MNKSEKLLVELIWSHMFTSGKPFWKKIEYLPEEKRKVLRLLKSDDIANHNWAVRK